MELGKYKCDLSIVVWWVEIHKKVTCSQCKQEIGGFYTTSSLTVMYTNKMSEITSSEKCFQ